MALTFGNDIKNSAFVLDKDVTHINHGSFGAAPKAVFEKRLGFVLPVCHLKKLLLMNKLRYKNISK